MSRQFGVNITVNAVNQISNLDARERYEEEVMLILSADLLNGSQVGRIVIESIWRAFPHRTRIQPWTARDSNAESVALDIPGATARGEPIRGTDGRRLPGAGFGHGGGTDTVVRFTPGRDPVNLNRIFPGALPVRPGRVIFDRAETLLHELCHTLRQMRGAETSRPMPRRIENEEEFFALLVTNIHASEHRGMLRADHDTRELTRPTDWTTGPLFPDRVRGLRRSLPDVADRLAGVSATFNPFRDVH